MFDPPETVHFAKIHNFISCIRVDESCGGFVAYKNLPHLVGIALYYFCRI